MSKARETYVCSACGATFPHWLGQCSRCGQWNTLSAVLTRPNTPRAATSSLQAPQAMRLQDAVEEGLAPFSCGLGPLDRLLGSGLVPGATILAGGEPGIGKSTLLLQVAGSVARLGKQVLYASGEETLAQIRARGERLGVLHDNLLAIATSSSEDVVASVTSIKPDLLILDSVQTLACSSVDGLPGNVNQVRAVATSIVEVCRACHTTGILVGHVTKDGTLAGPRLLEHMVDTVVSLEGDRRQAFRLMRVSKNRFGPSEEMLVFSMSQQGLEVVPDPSTFFLEDRDPSLSGTAVVMSSEARRPIAVEVQALVSRSYLTIPRRVALGFDANRLNLLLAVLEKRLRINFAQSDIYTKVGGGLRLQDPGLDIALVAAILSSYYDIPLPPKAIFFGEIDLNGQVRPVTVQQQRLTQAQKLGFSPIICPGQVQTIADMAARLFGQGAKQEQGEDNV